MPAQTVTWTGGVDDDFDERDNWDLKVVPGGATFTDPNTTQDTIIVPKTTSRALATNLDRSTVGKWASGVLTLTANAGNTETVTLDAKIYTFQTSLTDSDGNVKIGASASASIDNLIAAITLGSGSGTAYAASMTLHPTVSAYAGSGDTMDVRQVAPGVAGVASTETMANGSFGGETTLIGETTTGTDVLLLHVEDGAPAIGASGAPLKLGADKITFYGRNASFITNDGGSANYNITRLIVNSKNLVDALTLSDSNGTGKISTLEIISGGVTFSGPRGITTLRIANASGNNKPRLTVTSAAGALLIVFLESGTLTTAVGITICYLSGGTLTSTSTVQDMFQFGGLFVFNGTSVTSMDLVAGTMDTTRTAGTKTATLLRIYPAARLIENEDFLTASKTVIGV